MNYNYIQDIKLGAVDKQTVLSSPIVIFAFHHYLLDMELSGHN